MPCSVYCKPEENIHAYVEYSWGGPNYYPFVGFCSYIQQPNHPCGLSGQWFETLAVEPAREAPDCPNPKYKDKFLVTVKVYERFPQESSQKLLLSWFKKILVDEQEFLRRNRDSDFPDRLENENRSQNNFENENHSQNHSQAVASCMRKQPNHLRVQRCMCKQPLIKCNSTYYIKLPDWYIPVT